MCGIGNEASVVTGVVSFLASYFGYYGLERWLLVNCLNNQLHRVWNARASVENDIIVIGVIHSTFGCLILQGLFSINAS